MNAQRVLARLRAKAGAALEEAAAECAEVVREEHRRGAAEARGRLYGSHRASAPGDPPAILTSALYQGIGHARTGPLSAGVGVSGPAARYAVRLEIGDDEVAPRPLWRPSVGILRRTGRLRQALERGWRR